MPPIAIIGGGIGGLTAALSLLRAGLRRPGLRAGAALSEIGAGIQISPNASRVLHGLGLAERPGARRACGRWPWHQRRWDDGRTLLRTPLAEPLEAAFGFPHYQMHRADLLAALARRAARRARPSRPPARPRSTTTAIASRRAFANGARVDVDVLVGADGIHSPVRQRPVRRRAAALHRLRRLPRAGAGRAAARPRARGRPRRSGWARAATSCTTSSAAGRLVNFVAVVEQDTWTRESWTDRGDVARRARRLRRAGTRRSARSSARSTRRSSGRCSTAPRCRAGRPAA